MKNVWTKGLVVTAAAIALCQVGGAISVAAPTPAVAPATVLGSIEDGPGQYNIYRTVDSGLRPSEQQNAQCNNYFGSPRSLAVLERLDARMYTFESNSSTGFLTDPTAHDVGPIYVCDGPTVNGQAFLDQWGTLVAPGLGTLDMSGPCGLEFMIGQPGRGVVDCVLSVQPNNSGVTGGVATSNSVANPARLPDGRTGSLWTLYTLGSGTAPTLPPKPGSPQPTGTVKYNVGREVNSVSAGSSAACPGGFRTTEIHPVSTDPATGGIVTEPSADTSAIASVCYQRPSGAPDFSASLSITALGVSPSLTATSIGQCRQIPLGNSVQQSCGFTLPPQLNRGLNGGQVTINGLVPVGDPAGSANSAVWSTSFLGPITAGL